VLAKPGFQALETELVGFVKVGQELIRFEVIEFQTEAVDVQEGGGDGNGRSLVSIDERVILGEAFEQGSRLLDDVPVVATLRPGQGCFEGSAVANSRGPAKQGQQAGMGGQHVIEGGIERHWASRRSNSG